MTWHIVGTRQYMFVWVIDAAIGANMLDPGDFRTDQGKTFGFYDYLYNIDE